MFEEHFDTALPILGIPVTRTHHILVGKVPIFKMMGTTPKLVRNWLQK